MSFVMAFVVLALGAAIYLGRDSPPSRRWWEGLVRPWVPQSWQKWFKGLLGLGFLAMGTLIIIVEVIRHLGGSA
ncbi:hypothetical protein BFL40_11430 [Pseudomonas costantinii]|uniref:Uncharacterized protein n=1 Tax=Pseudomonas costantinii TaxID=168469 RepID=A0A1S2V4E0_9PSED|nr:hypothetical protein BFL40_11430 [Pseudomonas costantinii]